MRGAFVAGAGVSGRRVVLVDGPTLASLMIDHNVGVSPIRSFDLKRIDSDFFSEE